MYACVVQYQYGYQPESYKITVFWYGSQG